MKKSNNDNLPEKKEKDVLTTSTKSSKKKHESSPASTKEVIGGYRTNAPQNSKIDKHPWRFRSFGCIFTGGATSKNSDNRKEHQMTSSGHASNLSKHSTQALHSTSSNPNASTLAPSALRKPKKVVSRKGVEKENSAPSICSSTDVEDDVSLGSFRPRTHQFVVSTPKNFRTRPDRGVMKVRTLDESLETTTISKSQQRHEGKAKVSFDCVFVHYHTYQQLHHIPYGTTHGPPFLALGTRFHSSKISSVPNRLSLSKSRKKSGGKGRPQPLSAAQRYHLLLRSGVQPRGSTNNLDTSRQQHPLVPEPPKHRPQTPKKQRSSASISESNSSDQSTKASVKKQSSTRPVPQSANEVLSSSKVKKNHASLKSATSKPGYPDSRPPKKPAFDESSTSKLTRQQSRRGEQSINNSDSRGEVATNPVKSKPSKKRGSRTKLRDGSTKVRHHHTNHGKPKDLVQI